MDVKYQKKKTKVSIYNLLLIEQHLKMFLPRMDKQQQKKNVLLYTIEIIKQEKNKCDELMPLSYLVQ